MWSCKVHCERGNHLSHKTQLCSFEFTHLLECFWSLLPWKWCTTSSAQSYPTCSGKYESMVPKNSSVQESPYLVEFYLVPVWAAISFFRSPIVSSSLHLIRTWGSFYMICLHFSHYKWTKEGFHSWSSASIYSPSFPTCHCRWFRSCWRKKSLWKSIRL